MTSVGTPLYQAPEVSRGERHGFPADIFSFGITMYEICDRNLPYRRSERDNPIKLAADVALNGYRPEIREDSWNPAISCLIISCWCDTIAIRPTLPNLMWCLTKIMEGTSGLITVQTKGGGAASKRKGYVEPDFTPGALWRRVETPPSKITLGEILGQGGERRGRDRSQGGRRISTAETQPC